LGGRVSDVVSARPSGAQAKAERAIRQHVARELHDRVAQTLTGMLMELESFKSQQVGRASVLREASELQDSTRQVLQSIREMLYDLRGESSSEESFVSGLQSLLTKFEDRTRIAVELIVSPYWPLRVRSTAALNLYRIVEEALDRRGGPHQHPAPQRCQHRQGRPRLARRHRDGGGGSR
jgi:signal transduction histidine kinase